MGESQSKSFCVIGAGASGLSCASYLKSQGKKVDIFEASNRVGGRIQEIRGFCEGFIEIGGELIHGNKSMLFKMAQKAGAEIIPIKEESPIYCFYDGKFGNVDDHWDRVKDESFKEFWNLYEDLTEVCKGSYPDISIANWMISKGFSKESFYLADGLLGAEYSSDIDQISIQGVLKANYNWSSGSTDYFIKNMSLTDILKVSFANVLENIHFNQQITRIDYSDKEKIQIFDQEDKSFTYDICIITVPIPQIKKISFTPNLSEEKKLCLSKLQIHPSGKVFLKFSKVFWPKKMSFLLIPGMINVFWATKRGNDNLLVGFVGGKKCTDLTRIFQESKELFKKTLMNDLEKYMKTKVEEFLLDVYWMDWGDAEFFEGGYAHPIVQENTLREILKQPINNRIYFAGDTFSLDHASTLHGAIENGLEIAKNILK